jgi:hypothetical protein
MNSSTKEENTENLERTASPSWLAESVSGLERLCLEAEYVSGLERLRLAGLRSLPFVRFVYIEDENCVVYLPVSAIDSVSTEA